MINQKEIVLQILEADNLVNSNRFYRAGVHSETLTRMVDAGEISSNDGRTVRDGFQIYRNMDISF